MIFGKHTHQDMSALTTHEKPKFKKLTHDKPKFKKSTHEKPIFKQCTHEFINGFFHT